MGPVKISNHLGLPQTVSLGTSGNRSLWDAGNTSKIKPARSMKYEIVRQTSQTIRLIHSIVFYKISLEVF